MTRTKIEWATHVWNPVTGCTKVSEGCRHCYAERQVQRFGGRLHSLPEGVGIVGEPFSRVICHHDRLDQPLRWRKPRRVFVCSMSDLFHTDVPDLFICDVLDTIQKCPQHTFMVLTKRPQRMSRWPIEDRDSPIKNLWLGVSVENQATADERIPLLLQTPAACRFVSYEPALGPVNLSRWMWPLHWYWDSRFETPEAALAAGAYAEKKRQALVNADTPRLDWVICGGESGPKARPMHPDWARSMRDQCQAAGVPFFFKQWGEWAPGVQSDGVLCCARQHNWPDREVASYRVGKKAAGRDLDGRTHDEFPEVRPTARLTPFDGLDSSGRQTGHEVRP